MSMPMRLMHFRTFARLCEANWSHVRDLDMLAGKCAGSAGLRPDWAALVRSSETLVLVASECQLMVGALAVSHRPGEEAAHLDWLGVAPDARGRGVGSLLLATAIDLMRRGGALRLLAPCPAGNDGLAALLADMGWRADEAGHLVLALH